MLKVKDYITCTSCVFCRDFHKTFKFATKQQQQINHNWANNNMNTYACYHFNSLSFEHANNGSGKMCSQTNLTQIMGEHFN